VVDDVKNTRRTRSARSWGTYPTSTRGLAVPRWRGKQYERTPRSGPVIVPHRRVFSFSWAEGAPGGWPTLGDDVSMGRSYARSGSLLAFAPLRQGRVERFLLTVKWRCRLEGRNESHGAFPESDAGENSEKTSWGTRRRVKTRSPGHGLRRRYLRSGLVAIVHPGSDLQRH